MRSRAHSVTLILVAALVAPEAFAAPSSGKSGTLVGVGHGSVRALANQSALRAPSSKARPVGLASALVRELAVSGARSLREPSASGAVTLPTSLGQDVPLIVESHYFEGGRLSMTGRARRAKASSFIVKGDARALYGWLVLGASEAAYEYTTDARGQVVVERVPLSKIYPICNLPHPVPPPESELELLGFPRRAGPEPHIGDYDGVTSLHALESLPGAKLVFYLDITDIMDGEEPITLSSKAEMWRMWQSVASSLSMFDINVTTSVSVYEVAGVPNSGKACFYNRDGRSNSPLNAFGTTKCSSNYKNIGEGYGLGRTAAHEIGHTLGVSHDRGQPGGEYFQGFPDFEWCPIMGNYWYGDAWGQALYQWSHGEYASATNFEDDLLIINQNLPYRVDDIESAVPLVLTGQRIAPENNRGQIVPNTDLDEFTFEVPDAKSRVRLKVDRTEYIGGAMLDVAAELKYSGASVVAVSNVVKARYAEFDLELEPGDYTLTVKGGAEGTPEQGFSNYSSLGFYAISGFIGESGGAGGSSGSGGGGGTAGSAGEGGSAGSGAGGSAGDAGSGAGGGAGDGGSGGAAAQGGSGADGGAAGSGATGGEGAEGGAGSGGASGEGGSGAGGDGGGVGGEGGAAGAGEGGSGAESGAGGQSGAGEGGEGGDGGAGEGGDGGAGEGGAGGSEGNDKDGNRVTCGCRVSGERPAGASWFGIFAVMVGARRGRRRGAEQRFAR